MSASYRDHFIQSADGLSLYARVYERAGGDRPTALCLHGLTRNSADFEDLAEHLAGRFRVIAPDLRGRGRSGRDTRLASYQSAVYLADLATLLADLGVTRVAIIGTSLGGLLAMMMAAAQPPLVAGIVLNDIGPEIDPVGAARISDYAGRLPPVQSWDEAVRQLQTVFGAVWVGLSTDRWQRLVRRSYRADAAGVPRIDADPLIGEALRAAASTAAVDLWPIWRMVRPLPILVLRGELSDVLSVATLERMRREKADLEVVMVANRGHVPLLDEPECLAAIDGFLARLFS